MMVNFIEIIYFTFSCFITLTIYAIIGKLILLKNDDNFFDQIIFGIIATALISVILNFFLPLNKELNSIFQIVIILIYFIILKKRFKIKEIKLIFLFSFIIFILILFDTENRPDAYLYHLPYSQILNENKIIIGLSNFHFRFAHISIFQYLASFNFTIWSGLNGLILPAAIYCVVIFLYFLNDLKDLKKSKVNYGKIFSLLIFTYICLRINRYGEFGNDAMAHLTIFYLISKFIYIDSKKIDSFKKILFLSIFAFLNKPFLIFSFIFPVYLFFKNKFKIYLVIFNLPILFFILWLFKNVLISGCLLFPIEKTCFKSFVWSDKKEFYNQINSEGEAWAKGWPQRGDKNISTFDFNKKFNWVKAWQEKQFKNFLKNLVPFVLISLLIFFFLRGNYSFEKKIDKEKKIIIFLFSLLGSIFFLLKFPLYRYGYSYLIILISLIYIFYFKRINLNKLQNFTKYFILICIVGLSLKQLQRIYKNSDERTLIPSDRNLNLVNQKKIKKIKISDNFTYFYSSVECKYYKSPCTNYFLENIKHKKFWVYDIIYKK